MEKNTMFSGVYSVLPLKILIENVEKNAVEKFSTCTFTTYILDIGSENNIHISLPILDNYDNVYMFYFHKLNAEYGISKYVNDNDIPTEVAHTDHAKLINKFLPTYTFKGKKIISVLESPKKIVRKDYKKGERLKRMLEDAAEIVKSHYYNGVYLYKFTNNLVLGLAVFKYLKNENMHLIGINTQTKYEVSNDIYYRGYKFLILDEKDDIYFKT